MKSQSPGARVMKSLLNVHLATVLFGLAGVLGVLSGLPAPLIVLGRVAFASLALVVAVIVLRVPVRVQNRADLTYLALTGTLLAMHWTAFFLSIVLSNVATGLLSFATFPLFATVFEPLLLRTQLRKHHMLLAAGVIPGIALLVPQLSWTNHITLGVAFGLFAAATFAILSIANRGLGRRYHSLTISLFQEVGATMVLAPVLFWLHPSALLSARTLLTLVLLGVFCTAAAHTLFIEGMRSMTARSASLIASLEPVWGTLFGILLLNQHPAMRTILGGAIILAAATTPLFLKDEIGAQGFGETPIQ